MFTPPVHGFAGSSPLTRGKPFARVAPPAPPGLIPAHAGKTGTVETVNACPTAHPRSRGENVPSSSVKGNEAGSSPLTRGKLYTYGAAPTGQRLIPAHAGKTGAMGAIGAVVGAHPRSRGENIQTTVQTVTGWGSSPLTRGKRRRP